MALNRLYANNAQSTLLSGITSLATSATLSPGTGALFPAPTGTDYFSLTFYDAATGLINEIVHVTNVTGDVITMVRAQEGTTAKAWLAGDIAANLMTAGDITILQECLATQTVSVAGGTNVTLTATQANAQTLIFTGLKTANIQVIFPNQSRTYTLVNQSTGAFTLTAIQGTGTGSILPQNGVPYKVYSDAVNMYFSDTKTHYADDTGVANAYVITLNPAPTALVDGELIGFSTANTNTLTNPTANVNGIGAVTITNSGGSALVPGQIPANTPIWMTYNSTGPKFEIVNISHAGVSFATNGYQKYESGLIIQWGTATITAQGQVTNFPIAYPNVAYSVVTTSNATATGVWTTVGAITTTGFAGYGWYSGGASIPQTFFWIAVGH